MDAIRFTPLGYQQISALTLASATILTVPAGANMALVAADTAGVRFRDDGTAPTASVGILIPSGASPFQYTGNISALQFIAASGSPVLNVSYYRIAG